MFQLNLFKIKTAEQALELASWLRIEIITVRLEEMISDLKQKELFDDEPKKRRK